MVKEKKERYSFSRLSSFSQCKYGYKLTYSDHLKDEGNCFASYGHLMHTILERYAKGELKLSDLLDIYNWEFETEVPQKFPKTKYCPDMKKLYYEQGKDFLKNFKGYEGVKILGVENKFEYDIDDWTFIGIIDLIFEDENKKLVVQDHKSKSKFKNKQEQKEYARQLYLYSGYIKQKYGKFPDYLKFYLFRKQTPVIIEFNIDDYNEAIEWAKNMVAEIRSTWSYPPSFDDFYCEYLCGHRTICQMKSNKKGRSK